MSWTIDKARCWVDEARQFYIINGKRTALAEFTRPDGMFTEGAMYIFVLSTRGTMLAHGVSENFVGQEFLDLTDVDGKAFVREIVDRANSVGFGYVEYKWYHPITKKVEPKTVYFEKVENVIICSGVYLPMHEAGVLPVEIIGEARHPAVHCR
ncbi:MAG: cache domain-containing protein [Syntrophobacteraceae bacterium]